MNYIEVDSGTISAKNILDYGSDMFGLQLKNCDY